MLSHLLIPLRNTDITNTDVSDFKYIETVFWSGWSNLFKISSLIVSDISNKNFDPDRTDIIEVYCMNIQLNIRSIRNGFRTELR